MNEDEPVEAEGREHDALRAWGRDWKAPPDARGRTLETLRARGLVGAGARNVRGTWGMILGAAAAGVVAFVIGIGVGGQRETKAVPAAAEPVAGTRFMLLLYEDSAYRAATTPEGQKERVGEYSGWARTTAEAGRYVTGDELASDGRWCRMTERGLVTESPAADPVRGALAGYFVIGAESYDDALQIAEGCPHLKHGGTIEVRRIAT